MVFFEAPSRVAGTLSDMAGAFGAERRAAVCRELTKLHEEVVRGTLAELAEWAGGGVRGEVVLVVAGAAAREVAFPDAVTQVLEQVRGGTRLKDAAAEVSAHTGHSSRELYQEALARRAKLSVPE
jgi:Predicted methyltransferases